LSITNIVVTRS